VFWHHQQRIRVRAIHVIVNNPNALVFPRARMS